MAPSFRYRYVDFGTLFTGDPRDRAAEDSAESPGTLFTNELATDVGRTCWGANEPLPIIDHHLTREAQFPCAAAAVLHKVALIRQRFGSRSGTVWLVTHQEPDFDAFCSTYLARWIIDDPSAGNWEAAGLHSDGWLDLSTGRKIDWLNPDLSAVPPEQRWAFLLASYASVMETRHRVSCPRERALRSILYAALKRGRDYLNPSSGATEFFDEVRSVLQQQQLNPVFDSVLEGSTLFAPELAMLDREAEAYQRDIQRARRSTVYLPESEAPTPDFFKHPKQLRLHEVRSSSEVDAEHLLLADTFRIPTDGIFLRDPECLLFREWARLDMENSALGAGFEFTAIATSNGRSQATANKTDYRFAIDPERANGRHLYTVWSRLQTEEVEALKTRQQEVLSTPSGNTLRGSAGQKTATLESLLADPWLGGQSQFGTAVGTPGRGTLMSPAGVRSDLRDDPVAEAVRTELEGSIYSASSLVVGPQVTVFDFAGSRQGVDIEPRQYNLNAPLDIPASPETYFRFANIRLRADVPITNPNLTLQVGETLWQVLYPEMPGSTPNNFAERHLVSSAGSVGVWGDRGIAIAQKRDFATGASAPDRQAAELRDDFAALVSLARDVDRLTADWNQLSSYSAASTENTSLPERQSDLRGLQAIATNGEELARRAAQVKHSLTLPDRDLFRRFYEAINVDQLLETLRDLTHAASEHLRRHQLAEQSKQMESRSDAVARVQRKLEWLEVFIVGFFAVGIIDVITRHVSLGSEVEDALVLLGGPLFIGLTAWILKPWRKKPATEGKIDRPVWILIAVGAACVIAWLAGLAHVWTK